VSSDLCLPGCTIAGLGHVPCATRSASPLFAGADMPSERTTAETSGVACPQSPSWRSASREHSTCGLPATRGHMHCKSAYGRSSPRPARHSAHTSRRIAADYAVEAGRCAAQQVWAFRRTDQTVRQRARVIEMRSLANRNPVRAALWTPGTAIALASRSCHRYKRVRAGERRDRAGEGARCRATRGADG
jgi:hypothetical protein